MPRVIQDMNQFIKTSFGDSHSKIKEIGTEIPTQIGLQEDFSSQVVWLLTRTLVANIIMWLKHEIVRMLTTLKE